MYINRYYLQTSCLIEWKRIEERKVKASKIWSLFWIERCLIDGSIWRHKKTLKKDRLQTLRLLKINLIFLLYAFEMLRRGRKEIKIVLITQYLASIIRDQVSQTTLIFFGPAKRMYASQISVINQLNGIAESVLRKGLRIFPKHNSEAQSLKCQYFYDKWSFVIFEWKYISMPPFYIVSGLMECYR